jgi:hypothetical protein
MSRWKPSLINDSCMAVSCEGLQPLLSWSYLLVHIELPEDLRRVQQVLVLKDPTTISMRLTLIVIGTYFFPFQANSGRFRISAIQYPLMRNRKVRKAWTAASGMMYVFRRLQRSIGLM